MLFKETTLEDCQSLIGADVYQFINDFLIFVKVHSRNISEYYAGNMKVPNAKSFSELSRLLEESKHLTELINLNREVFTSVADWNLLEKLEEINHKLNVWSRISKFLRSPIVNLTYTQGIQSEYGMKQNETLESVNRQVLNALDFDNTWVDLAVTNNVREEDYTPAGGKVLSVVFNKAIDFNIITSVIDNIEGEKVYGRDLTAKLTFLDHDLEVLEYFQTAKQSVEILCNLAKGDVPEFPEDGISFNLVVGSNLNNIAYPVLFRQYYNLFSKDDTFSAFSITNVSLEKDALYLEAEIRTVYGDILIEKVRLS